jgi:hypothetical protein
MKMSISVQQMADRVAELMEARLRVKGDDLSGKLQRGRKLLPRRVQGAAQFLAEASEQAKVPKLLVQIDPERTAEAYDTCVRYLKPLGVGARRRAWFLGAVTSAATVVVVTVAMVLGVLMWRGFI